MEIPDCAEQSPQDPGETRVAGSKRRCRLALSALPGADQAQRTALAVRI